MRLHLAVVALAACTAPEPGPRHRPDPAATPTDSAWTDTAPIMDTAPTMPGTTDTATTDTPTKPPVDCTVLPPLPAQQDILGGFYGAEDFDFDHDGYAVVVHNGNLVGRDRLGNVKIVASGVAANPRGTRILHDGTWVVADGNRVVRVDPATGAVTIVYSGSVNGIEVEGDHLYVTASSQILRLDVNDPDDVVVIETWSPNPNGLILSPDGQTLYVADIGVVAYDRQVDDTWSGPRALYEGTGFGYLGINVDVCGNVYVTDVGDVLRITPDGSRVDPVGNGAYLPNLRWGQGAGGFEADTLYAIDWGNDALWAYRIGIPGKPHVMGP